MKRSAENILANQLKGIVAGVKRFESTDALYELTPVLSGIRLLLKERGSGSVYKELNLGKVEVLSTLIKPSDFPQSDSIVRTWTGLTISSQGEKASTSRSIYNRFITLDEWWEDEYQVVDGNRLSRKNVVLDSQLDSVLHTLPMRSPAVKVLARTESHFQYVKQYGYELSNSPQLLELANLDIEQLWQTENSQ